MAQIIRPNRFNAHALNQEILRLFALLKENGHHSFYGERMNIRPYILEELAAWEPIARQEQGAQMIFGEGLSEDFYREIVGILEEEYFPHHQVDCNELGEAPEEDPIAGLTIVDIEDWKHGYQDPEWENIVFFNDFTPEKDNYLDPFNAFMMRLSSLRKDRKPDRS
jgi:hypothetical protein